VRIAAAGSEMGDGKRWILLGGKALVALTAGVAAGYRAAGHDFAPLMPFAGWATGLGILEVVEALLLKGNRGRILLAGMAIMSLAFGALLILASPQTVVPVLLSIAAFSLVLGILRLILSWSLETTQLV
jgi:uncharacterized membrane protein HdeD (DUF308 family)